MDAAGVSVSSVAVHSVSTPYIDRLSENKKAGFALASFCGILIFDKTEAKVEEGDHSIIVLQRQLNL